MADTAFRQALESTREIQITVTGRRTGRQISLPVWFVVRDGKLCLMPVSGSDTNWFKNVQQNPTIRVRAGDAEHTAQARPITDPAEVGEVVEAFRAKYGARDVQAYYPKTDVAAEVPLP
jgi:deazaflavin-dependent oxidoreductase (nitroreductase family)